LCENGCRKTGRAAVPGYFPVLGDSSRFGQSSELKQNLDTLDNFETHRVESNDFPVIFPVHGNLLLTWVQ
jgi:hypothetical protein